MKNLLIIASILSFTATAQTVNEQEMFELVNQVRTNPKSFIPVVESYIAKLEAKKDPFADINIKGAFITKKTNNAEKVVDPMIVEAKALINFLKSQKAVKALGSSKSLYGFAKAQSVYMDSIKTVTHNGPNGESTTKRFTKSFGLNGENCVKAETATEAVLFLLIDLGNSTKGHRKNIFSKDFTKMAIGNTNNYWAQDFAY